MPAGTSLAEADPILSRVPPAEEPAAEGSYAAGSVAGSVLDGYIGGPRG
ncbi:hypothetical protein [Methylobacterium sp. CM6244]